MASARQIKALLESHFTGDDAHFHTVAMQLAANEAKSGHGKLAEEIRALIDKAKARKSPLAGTSSIARPRGELAGLLDVSYPKTLLSDMILERQVLDRLIRAIKEQRHFTKIRSHGLSPRRKLLLIGPPGTGKTLTASVLAGELGLPLLQVRFDTLITKYMGETAAKLRLIFDAVAETRAVYFFDEFDAIGSHRGMSNDVGEIRRILNSFLQLIEQDDSHSIIIAATNHPQILDYALFRRFDDIVKYGLPEKDHILVLLKNKLSGFQHDLTWEKPAAAAEGLSHAEIVRAAEDAVKDALIHDKRTISQNDLLLFLEERKAIRPGI